DERVNAIVLRDTPETIQVAERVVIGLDIPQSEVTLDVQVLEVNVNDSVDLGLQYPGKIQFSALGAGEEVGLTLGDLLRLNRDRIGVASESGALSMAIDMLQKQGKTRTLANPKIRVRNLEKANIRIGERVPIVTTTNGNGVVTESVSYQDVGLMLKVEPRVSLDDEVSVKVSLEVSNILSEQRTRSVLVGYSLGTRNADTLMTPHIERRLDLPEAAVTTFLSGTETRVTTEALSLAPAGAGREPSPPKL
ncbi:type II secretion system protein GspD, partial [Burkholderia cepacia]|uniref:type II secretion system protein GspD n=1 Tax=Burkholderia cepacia TaxID=292 RepID=UPI003C7C7CA9